MSTSNQAYQATLSDNDFAYNRLFDEEFIRKADAINNRVPLFDGKRCKDCGTTKKINTDSDQWSDKGNHTGECYNCYQTNAIIRRKRVNEYIVKYPEEKARLGQLVKIRNELTNQTGEKHHIHHIVPVRLKNQFSDPEHSESCNNKIVLSESEHKEVHRLINLGHDPLFALDQVLLGKDKNLRIA